MSEFVNARSGTMSILSFSSVGSSGTFTAMAALANIGDVSKSKPALPLDTYGTTDGYKQFIPGAIVTMAPQTFSAYYLSTNTYHASILNELMENGTRVGYKVALAGTSSNNIWYGDCLITDITLRAPYEDKIAFDCTIQPNGKPLGPLSSTT